MTFKHTLLALPLLLLAACEYPDDTLGANGLATFIYADCACNLGSNAVAVGGRTPITVTFKDDVATPIAAVASSDERVARFSVSPDDRYTVIAEGVAAGRAELQILDVNRRVVVERVTVIVEPLRAIGFDAIEDHPRVIAGGRVAVWASPRRAEGGQLVGVPELQLVADGAVTLDPRAPQSWRGTSLTGGIVVGLGAGGVIARTPDGSVQARLPVDGIAPEALESLTAETVRYDGGQAFVHLRAADVAGPVWGVTCDWQLPTYVGVLVQSPLALWDQPETDVTLALSKGTYHVVCRVGGRETALDVTRQ
jgi:hypothetical protein